ncbi:MAG TPA: triphosphoribosyl-dephospho-CoA synthase [Anaeromyxobacteraceae bacterium]|nr:triphosphoribosyl-dephospho-CoA synthase [Anaeromyxobacteraceae bacterium]
MPYGESRPDPLRVRLLAARDARQALLERHREAGGGRALVALSLAIPGSEKAPPGARPLFDWALGAARAALPGARLLHRGDDALGPLALLAADADPAAAKRACVAVEEARPAARLVDLDVYADGAQVDRSVLGLSQRGCLACGAPARECIRAGRHRPEEVVARARALLQGLLPASLAAGLKLELLLTPKPGLVDRADRGSHPDLSLALMERSIGLVAGYLDEVHGSLARQDPLDRQVALGREAERRMLAACGTNTHKGAIFLGGLLLAASARAAPEAGEAGLRRAIASVSEELLAGRALPASHGEAARRAFSVGGILGEALRGLPAVFEAALPAWRAATSRGRGDGPASFAMLAALMQSVEDTTALHRCGAAGLATLRADGRRLAALLEAGEAPEPFLAERNRAWVAMNLTMGGVADLLGLALGLLVHEGAVASPA